MTIGVRASTEYHRKEVHVNVDSKKCASAANAGAAVNHHGAACALPVKARLAQDVDGSQRSFGHAVIGPRYEVELRGTGRVPARVRVRVAGKGVGVEYVAGNG